MAFTEKLHESAEYRANQTKQEPEGPVESSVPSEVAPVVSLEKGDIEFWANVATVVLLYLILQELKRGGHP